MNPRKAGAFVVFASVLAAVAMAPTTEEYLGRFAGVALGLLFAALTYVMYFRKT